MTAFHAASAALFADRNMAADALYRAGGTGIAVPLRVIRSAPDRIASFGEGRFVTDTVLIDVRVGDAPNLAPGDTFEIAGALFEVRGEPTRDAARLILSAEAREL